MLELLAATLLASQNPIQRVGTCPLGYYSSGGYCNPTNEYTKPAIQKYDSCPLGWYSTGSYCAKTHS
jgi:hypothetical protein